MAVGVVEVGAPAALAPVDLPRITPPGPAPERNAPLHDASVDRVEVGLGDPEREVKTGDRLGIGGGREVERHAVLGAHLPEPAHRLGFGQPQHLGEPAGTGFGVAGGDDRVIQFDGHGNQCAVTPGDR